MPRYVANESEDETEPKTGRRTRAALAASAPTESPMRRSTRIRHGSVNPDGSSPESVTDTAPTQVTRVTRRRAAAAAADNTSTASEQNPRVLRSRKNSVSSNLSDNLDVETAPSTPKGRSSKRLSIVEPSPSTPKPAPKTKRTVRASSETKSPAPVVRATRRTRATSIDPEPVPKSTVAGLSLTTTVSTPTRKRRTLISAFPTEPVLTEEETSEEKVDSEVEELPEILQKSSRTSAKKSKKDDSAKEHTDAEMETDESFAGKSSGDSSAADNSSPISKSGTEKAEESEVLKSAGRIQTEDFSPTDNNEVQNSTKAEETLVMKTKRGSLDKSKELGMKIENLLNKSTEEQEKSPGNKENEKLNVSPDKIRKNLEFTVSNVNIVRGKSLGSSRFLNKSGDKKLNSSLDERVLSKSRYDIVATKSVEIDDKKLGNSNKNVQDSSTERKSYSESPGVVKSPKKNGNGEHQAGENEGERSKSKTGYTKVDETIVENEVIEEFTLYDSNDSFDAQRSEFRLTVEEDVDSEAKNSSSKIGTGAGTVDGESNEPSKNKSDEDSKADTDSDSDSNIFNLKRLKNRSKTPESGNKQDKKNQSTEGMEVDEEPEPKSNTPADDETNNQEITTNIDEESMDTNEHGETNDNSAAVSPEKQSLDKIGEKEKSADGKVSKTNGNNQVSDSDSNVEIDHLFHNISAEEWKKLKNTSPKKRQSKDKASLKSIFDSSQDSKDENDVEDDAVLTKEKSWKEDAKKDEENADFDFDSDNTVILQKNGNKKRKSLEKTIAEQIESDDTEVDETLQNKKSPNKSAKSNKSLKDESKDQIEEEKEEDNNRKSVTKARGNNVEIDDDISEAETIPTNADNPDHLKDTNSKDEEKRPASSKNTPKNKKNKSPAKSATKSKKSTDVYEFDDSLEGDQSPAEDEEMVSVNSKTKSGQKRENNSALEKRGVKMDKNYSMVALVDSDSGSDNVTDPDCPSSDNSKTALPGYLFNVESSGDEKEKSDTEEEEGESHNTIDSDIAKEMNLAGDDDVEYSDDNVPADDCRDSESEYSDEHDAGSDIGDFVVPDDEVESSEYSEEEEEFKIPKFKRILHKSSSEEDEEDEEDIEENEENDVQKIDIETEKKHTNEKPRRKSLRKTPDDTLSQPSEEESTLESPELRGKKLNFSIESEVTASIKKTKKGKVVRELGESEITISPNTMDLEKSDKKPKKRSKALKSLLNSTIDLCTPEQNAVPQTKDKTLSKSPGLNTSLNNKSLKKLRKSLVEDLATLTPDDTAVIGKDEEEELLATPKEITPNKEKKTPKSGKKNNQRDSIQLIEENALAKPKVSELNRTMLTPNSETPVTKFLKKERLNESLPLLELKKRASKSFNKQELSKMNENEQEDEDDDISETDGQKEIAEESENEENEVNDEEEENVDEINGNSHRDDGDEDGTDEEPNKEEENVDEDEEIENESEDEEPEESSEEEININKKRLSRSGASEELETPKKVEKKRKSTGRKSESNLEVEDRQNIVRKNENEPEDEESEESSEEEININKKRQSRSGASEEPETLNKVEKKRKSTGRKSEANLEVEDGQNIVRKIENEPEDEESEESSEEEININKKRQSRSGVSEEPETLKKVEKKRKSTGRKSEANLEVEDGQNTVRKIENEAEDEESEESSEEEININKKRQSRSGASEEPETLKKVEKKRKSTGRKSEANPEEDGQNTVRITPNKKQSRESTSGSVNGMDTDSSEEVVNSNKKRNHSLNESTSIKKRARLDSNVTPQSLKHTKRTKIASKADTTLEIGSDSDEAPESVGFSEARSEALQVMKDVATSVKAAKEAKKKKRRDQLERVRKEKEAKAVKKSTTEEKRKPEASKTNLKRLSEDILDNLSDVPQNPQKKRKLLKKEEQIMPSRSMLSPGKSPINALKIENSDPSTSTSGGTTHFSVVNLEKVKKQPKKVVAIASFRERMLARNPRQPVSAFLMYQAKQKASGKQLSSRKQA